MATNSEARKRREEREIFTHMPDGYEQCACGKTIVLSNGTTFIDDDGIHRALYPCDLNENHEQR